MTPKTGKSLPPFGFLNAVESPQLGLLGGYLVVSAEGRPLEFRCTTPVRASRAQEILYGTTLDAYLHSEVLGLPLVTGARLRPPTILTPNAAWRQLAWHVDAQIVHLAQTGSSSPGDVSVATDPPIHRIGRYCLVEVEGTGLSTEVLAGLERLSNFVPLDEPFERIELALDEVLAVSTASEDLEELAGPCDAAA